MIRSLGRIAAGWELRLRFNAIIGQMCDKIRVFLGSDEYGSDFPELEGLRKQAEREGFHGFRNNISLEENLGRFPMPNIKVLVRGAYAGYCVAHTVDYFLEMGAEEIEVDLPNCRTSEDDSGRTAEAI